MKNFSIFLVRSGALRDDAVHFITQQMGLSHNVFSRQEDVPEDLFVAYLDGGIVASLGVEYTKKSPSLHLYNYRPSVSEIVLVRWLSIQEGVGRLLLKYVVSTMLKKGYTHALCIMKEPIFKYIEKHSPNCWKRFDSVKLFRERVPLEYSSYFFTEPYPYWYRASLQCLRTTL